jgi:hypothetical protein
VEWRQEKGKADNKSVRPATEPAFFRRLIRSAGAEPPAAETVVIGAASAGRAGKMR